jgi:hypothetical protein
MGAQLNPPPTENKSCGAKMFSQNEFYPELRLKRLGIKRIAEINSGILGQGLLNLRYLSTLRISWNQEVNTWL